ncbi:MAG: hypothetical protein CL933_26015 [Deltaproteobacteria bacterium]|nr:hypothetical protein [Deltaproteobacteria bacterium]
MNLSQRIPIPDPLTALSALSFFAFGALLVLYGANSSELITHLDLDYADLGLLGSMFSLGLGVGIVAAGPISDRLPRRPLYIAACFTVLAATATLSAATDYHALLLRTVAIGFGAGFYETILNALIVEEFGARAPRRLIFIHSAATLAGSVTPLLFEFARTFLPLAWYDAFQIVGSVHAGLILAAIFVPMNLSPRRAALAKDVDEDPAVDGRERAKREAAPMPRRDDRPALVAICVATFAYVGVETALTLFVADHAIHDLGLEAAHADHTISAFWAGLLVGRLAIGLSPRRVGAGTTAALASLGAILLLSYGLGWIVLPELAMAAIGFCLGGVFPIMIGLAGIALPSSAGIAVGLAGGLGSLGGFVIPWFTGRIATHTAESGLSMALTSLAAWLGLLVVATIFARRHPERER